MVSVRLLDDRDDQRAASPHATVVRDVRGRHLHRRRRDVHDARIGRNGGARNEPDALGRRPRTRGRDRRVARRHGLPADTSPGPRALAPDAAAAARDRPLRNSARPRVHDVRADVRILGARRAQRRLRDAGTRPCDRPRVRNRPGAAYRADRTDCPPRRRPSPGRRDGTAPAHPLRAASRRSCRPARDRRVHLGDECGRGDAARRRHRPECRRRRTRLDLARREASASRKTEQARQPSRRTRLSADP